MFSTSTKVITVQSVLLIVIGWIQSSVWLVYLPVFHRTTIKATGKGLFHVFSANGDLVIARSANRLVIVIYI